MKSTKYISPIAEIVELKLAENFASDDPPTGASLGPLPCLDPDDPDCEDIYGMY
ncbi:MAG: hypothetical protein FWF72_03395 [Paludibacter sp.]|nr:hypothetical protein [Paludibacter sp.]